MTTSVYTILRYSRKATFCISSLFPSIFSCHKARQRPIPGSTPSLDVLWKQGGALAWLEPGKSAEGLG